MAGYTAYNLRIILILTLGSLTFGYAYSVISGTLGQPGFLDYFNLRNDESHTQAITGTINGLVCAGAVFGSLAVGWMCDARGRKETLYLTCVVNIFGEALQAGSVNLGMFLAARFIGGWGIGMAVVLIPLYQAEICKLLQQTMPPPSARGFLVGQHGTFAIFGYAIAGWVGVGAYYSTNLAFQWRFPIAVAFPGYLNHLAGDEAWAIVSRLHGGDQDEDSLLFAREEFYQMAQQVQADNAAWISGGYHRQIFTKPSYRKRIWMGFFIQYAAQSTGAQVIYVYIISLYQNLGLTGGIPLVLGAAYVTVATLSNFTGALLLDKIGRKPLFREIFPTHIRPQGVAWSLVGTFLSTLVYVEAAPTALANIKWGYYIIFIGLTLINIVILYLWCPEAWAKCTDFFSKTKGLSLEEINEKFGDEVVVHLTNATDKQLEDLAHTIQAEQDEKIAMDHSHHEKTGVSGAQTV
ncbi:Major facilitator superfamily transporter mfsA [Hyphodiscus hymeniophilus]|uniref:Major facilitator superfamily transporter mfsA n=1 Tax=Hyphodiscus hymeniophilus TaxID=353542 RepID=A0A9P6VEB3_9HELO|nr:Major facilitator superfamily transporter mfsA [Hyphodiscus hymeniophilus]